MYNSRYRRLSKGDIYNISFWGSLSWTFLVSTIIYMIGFMLTMGITFPSLIESILAYVNSESLPQELISSSFIIQVTSGILPIVLLIYIFRKDFAENWRQLKQKPLYYLGLIIGICILSYIAIYIVDLIYKKLQITGNSENQEAIEKAINSPARILVFIATVIQAPILEELIFRKTFFGMLEHKFKINRIVILVLSTIFFAGIHVLSPGNLKYIFVYLPVSFALSFSYFYTGNLFVPITIHFINNFIVFLNVIGVTNV